jgi:hypothetical protein
MTFKEFEDAVGLRLRESGITDKTFQVTLHVWEGPGGIAVLTARHGDTGQVYLGFGSGLLGVPQTSQFALGDDGVEAAATEILQHFDKTKKT